MKRLFVVCVLLLTACLHTRPAGASTLYVNFCPGDATCPAGISEASLTFTEVLGTSDPNDYILQLTIVGNALSPMYIDEVSFSISGVRTPQDYTSVTLLDAPEAGSPWIVYFDVVSATIKSCTKDTNRSQEICSQSDPGGLPPNSYGAIANGTNIWTYSVNLAPGISPLAAGSIVNLRAQFLNSDGTNAGILSPAAPSPNARPARLRCLSPGRFCCLVPASWRSPQDCDAAIRELRT